MVPTIMPSIVSKQFELTHGLESIVHSTPSTTSFPFPESGWKNAPETVPSQTERLWNLATQDDAILERIGQAIYMNIGNPTPDWFRQNLRRARKKLKGLRQQSVDPDQMHLLDSIDDLLMEQETLDQLAWEYRQALLGA